MRGTGPRTTVDEVLSSSVGQDRLILHRFTYFNTELVFCQVSIFLGWGGVSERYKNVTFCNIFSAFRFPFVGEVFPRENPCELELFPRFGVSIFCVGEVFLKITKTFCVTFLVGFRAGAGFAGFRKR